MNLIPTNLRRFEHCGLYALTSYVASMIVSVPCIGTGVALRWTPQSLLSRSSQRTSRPVAIFGDFRLAFLFDGYLHIARGGLKDDICLAENNWLSESAAAPWTPHISEIFGCSTCL